MFKPSFISLPIAALCALLLAGVAHASNDAVLLKRAAPLRESPGEAGRSLVDLPVQTPVTRLGQRQGAWLKVRAADGTQGWLHMFDVAAPSTPSSGNAGVGALRGITNFFNKGSAQQTGTVQATSTVGIRGLGAEDLAQAQPDMAALMRLEKTRLDANQARQFASAAGFRPRQIEPLAAPSAPATSSNSTNRSGTSADPFSGSNNSR